jgi:3' terminal RNA ribose 2'-O-methyltransferase Hen1
VHTFDLAFGKAHAFYAEATEARCRAVLLLDVDPVALVRKRSPGHGSAFPLSQYVNDRPYVASSLLSVALKKVFGTALAGNCALRPDLPAVPLPLTARLPVVPVRGGEGILRRIFEPLGYAVAAARHELAPDFPDWGESPYWSVELTAKKTVREMLSHLYVLVPVLDDDKHYWVSRDELTKLLRAGEGWLAEHPEKELISRRYLKHQRGLTREALLRLTAEDEAADPDGEADARTREEQNLERPISLARRRLDAVAAAMKERGAHRVLDLGCGEGRLVRHLLADPAFTEIVGLDVSHRALEIAKSRLERKPDRVRNRVRLLHGSLLYRDDRLAGYDAAACVEVVEHLDPPRLAAFERNVFEFARPATVVLTTPNREYNVRFEGLAADRLRHRDHRFEWTREEFRGWAEGIAGRFGYAVEIVPVGDEDPEVGAPTGMGVFTR